MAQQPGQSLRFDRIPSDTISDIATNSNPNNQLLCCTSWDNSITIWKLNGAQNALPAPQYLTTVKPEKTNDAMLCCTFKGDDILVGTASGKILQLKYGESTVSNVGSHLGIVSGVRWCPNQNLLMSGSSYDFKLNFWDLRDTTKPASSVDLQGKCRCLDATNDKAFIVTSENKVYQYDLKLADKKLKSYSLKIKCPITSIAITPDGNGYVVGGQNGIIEANVNGTGGDLKTCHRDNNGVYSSNCIAISGFSTKNIIISGGGNGSLEYFSLDTLAHTSTRPKLTQNGDPVTACAFLPKQKSYVVATGNDWSHGAQGSNGAPSPEMQVRMLNGKETVG